MLVQHVLTERLVREIFDPDFTRKNARGSREDAQAEITPDQICGALPKGFDAKAYATRPWTITEPAKLSNAVELMEFICNENNRDLKHLPGRK